MPVTDGAMSSAHHYLVSVLILKYRHTDCQKIGGKRKTNTQSDFKANDSVRQRQR